MYHALIATNEADMLERLAAIDWPALDFASPLVVATAEEAINAMESHPVDCVAYRLDANEARRLSLYLASMRPSLPLFEVRHDEAKQLRSLKEVKRVLDRLRTDGADEELSDSMIMDMLRDELTHNLLSGEISEEKVLRSRLQMLRSPISPDRPCVLYEFDLPQGEVYLNSQWRYGSERLENALRNNFFGRFYEDLYYTVAVLTPRHIRLVVCQRVDHENEPVESLVTRADQHIMQVVDSIKQYLNLDMVLSSRMTLDNLCTLIGNVGEKR